MSERWLPVPGFSGYEVSDEGRVRSRRRRKAGAGPRMLKLVVGFAGYTQVALHGGVKQQETKRVHNLVLAAFVGPLPEGLVTRHLNGNPEDNRLENLAYGTPTENGVDIVRHGRHFSANKTHCPQGHEYTAENTYVGVREPRGRRLPFRMCRTCMRERSYRAVSRKALARSAA